MKTSRILTISVGFLVCAGILSTVYSQFFSPHLPDPATADREGLVRWLVLSNVADHPSTVHQALIGKLLEELDQGIELSEVKSQLSPKQEKQLWKNVDFLSSLWFSQKAQDFTNLPSKGQLAWLQKEIQRIESWNVLDQLRDPIEAHAGHTVDTLHAMADFNKITQKWINRAPPEEQQKQKSLVSAVQSQLLMHAFFPSKQR